MTAAAATDPIVDVPVSQRWLILASIVLGSTIYNATILVASGLQPQMQGAMSATQDEIAWTVTFNILATAIVTPMTGWLTARFGARNVMIWSVFTFTVGTLMCGLAGSLESLVFWRIVQGGGGAPLVPLGQTILLNVFPSWQHGLAISVFGVANMAGPVIGPSIGGYIAEVWSWRWVFYLMAPFGAAAFLAFRVTLPRDEQSQRPALDWTGFLALASALALAQIVLSRGQRLDWFESTEIAAATALSAIALYVFVAHCLTATKPFLSPAILLDRNYALGFVLVTAFGMLNFTPMVLLPQLLQAHAGYPDSLIGYVIAWRGLGAILGFFISDKLARIDPRIGMAGGFALHALSGWWLSSIDLNVPDWVLAANGFIQGTAIGVIWVPMSFAAFRTLAPRYRAEAMGVFHLMRNIGSSFFISMSVAEIVRATGANYSRIGESVSSFNRSLNLPWVAGSWSVESLPDIARLAKEVNRQAALIGYLNAFSMYMLASLCAIPLALILGTRSRR
ncbi:MAG: DHA2 family efflux MFS transporter permease subunit [Hyphomicrobiaceae bacterium]|nr:DHA2 family efflux MFS transporter permease subunit [Hyphomicrobiaceae bacterium]